MLDSTKIKLRPLQEADTELIVKWRNSDQVKENFIFQDLLTPEQHQWWFTNRVQTGQVAQFIIISIETGRPVGSVYLRDIDRKHKKCEYGIFIGEDEARGKGYGTEAARMICNYGFTTLGLHRIFLRAFAHNEQAIRSYEKAGFVQEGRLKDEVCFENIYYDVIIMAQINPNEV